MIRKLLLFSLLSLPFILFAFDPEDDSFDPTVKFVIADGSARLGDPSPFLREGYDERGFTYVQANDSQGKKVVQVSFIKMPDADDPAKNLGGAMFLPLDTAKAFAAELAKGEGLDKPVKVWDSDWAGKWTLSFVDGKGVVLEQAMNGQAARFILSANAAKKLAGAVTHSVGEAEK